MATTPATKQLYPLATNDGKEIPLDVIYPSGTLWKSFSQGGYGSFVLPAGWEIAAFYSLQDCVVQFGNTAVYPLVDNVELVDSLFVPAGTVINAVIPAAGACRVIPLTGDEPGWLMIQKIEKYAGLGLAKQLTVR